MYRGGISERKGKTVEDRKRLYYGTCVWVRLLLAFVVGILSYYHTRNTGIAIAVVGGLTAVGNFGLIQLRGIDSVWWNRGAHSVFSLFIAALGVLIIYKKVPWYFPALFIVVNVLYGIIYSFIVKPYGSGCRQPPAAQPNPTPPPSPSAPQASSRAAS